MKQILKKLLLILSVIMPTINAVNGMDEDRIIRPIEYAGSVINFWNDIGYTEAKSEEVCGRLDIEQMNGFLEKIFEMGKTAVDTDNLKLTEAVFITLWIPNFVLNTEGDAETYFVKYIDQHMCSYETFAEAVKEKGRTLFEVLMQCFEGRGGDKQKLLQKIGVGTII